MTESFEVNGRKFEIAPSVKARALDAHILETGKMLSTLGTMLDRLERTVPESMPVRGVGVDIRRVVREELINAASLLAEIAEHTAMLAQESRAVVDNESLSEQAQTTALGNLIDLSARYDGMKERLERFSKRFGMKL